MENVYKLPEINHINSVVDSLSMSTHLWVNISDNEYIIDGRNSSYKSHIDIRIMKNDIFTSSGIIVVGNGNYTAFISSKDLQLESEKNLMGGKILSYPLDSTMYYEIFRSFPQRTIPSYKDGYKIFVVDKFRNYNKEGKPEYYPTWSYFPTNQEIITEHQGTLQVQPKYDIPHRVRLIAAYYDDISPEEVSGEHPDNISIQVEKEFVYDVREYLENPEIRNGKGYILPDGVYYNPVFKFSWFETR